MNESCYRWMSPVKYESFENAHERHTSHSCDAYPRRTSHIPLISFTIASCQMRVTHSECAYINISVFHLWHDSLWSDSEARHLLGAHIRIASCPMRVTHSNESDSLKWEWLTQMRVTHLNESDSLWIASFQTRVTHSFDTKRRPRRCCASESLQSESCQMRDADLDVRAYRVSHSHLTRLTLIWHDSLCMRIHQHVPLSFDMTHSEAILKCDIF